MRWFHVVLTTYGAWLPGDPRGFRTRRHRDHVEGDYKRPPSPGVYEGLHRASRENQAAPSTTIPLTDRERIAKRLRDKLERLGAELAILAVAGRHVHILIKMPAAQTRKWIGFAKRHVTFRLRAEGFTDRLWASGAKFVPIRDRSHQLNVYRYIEKHEVEGAFILRRHDRD